MKREMKSVKNLSVFVAEQNEKWSEKKVVFCSYRCILESEKLKCERKFCKRVKFFVHVWHFKAVFFSIFWQKGLVMIFLISGGLWQWSEGFWKFI